MLGKLPWHDSKPVVIKRDEVEYGNDMLRECGIQYAVFMEKTQDVILLGLTFNKFDGYMAPLGVLSQKYHPLYECKALSDQDMFTEMI